MVSLLRDLLLALEGIFPYLDALELIGPLEYLLDQLADVAFRKRLRHETDLDPLPAEEGLVERRTHPCSGRTGM